MTRRFELLKKLVPLLQDELVISNIGFPSQELYRLGDRKEYFYMLGSMGMASSIGLGVSLGTHRRVLVIDGDGSVLMNLGTLATIANFGPENYTLLIVDNGAYGSTGDQPTHTSGKTDLAAMARGAGVSSVMEVGVADMADALARARQNPGPHIIVIRVAPGSPSLKPIPLSPVHIRDRFMGELKGDRERTICA
ncbi:MAG: sulfopyruvate decarboxylase subunit beta [Deltaproteobacteria bacterium]|jgi:sulfopyruvate decarboxylase subunit beta|nr:sulfopyruvate decarboxylase subunit beta [Deltaproteobacteria bacterium]